MDLGLTYEETARRIGTKRRAIYDWEFGRFEPTVSVLPRVILFLDYDPRREPATWPEWLVWYRVGRGLSQAAMAEELGVSPRTLGLWETGKRKPANENLAKLTALRG